MPIVKKDADSEAVMAAVKGLEAALKAAGVRVKLDASTDRTPGWKFNQYEMKGVPVRVEVSPSWPLFGAACSCACQLGWCTCCIVAWQSGR